MADTNDTPEGGTSKSTEGGEPAGGGSGTATKVRPRPKNKSTTKQLPPWNVILLDDDDHSYDYVIEMLGKVCAHPVERAMQMAKEVDSTGRVIVLTTHKERAELKRDQILSYGPDQRIARSSQSMKAVIEPAEDAG
ncbi:ATP-dependent Clp protease adaptor ClpS [Humisphaera borealis]|uniref:ATP-dependent Clp protease adaptor ClpS n=1 Tax=Humisphaera borealis TaxID=2807512 RepID=A0A7M2WZA5_9BACT|nr:ATP-dependent Clp protease adaptor ClpS [Humisphaera borealis]QOV90532.1 ATP-dependent Clp protease adaptor ClpS [Humisphaera borealis]